MTKKNKSQVKEPSEAVMEFLMNYGWVIFVLLILAGTFMWLRELNPDRFLPEKSRETAFQPVPTCVEWTSVFNLTLLDSSYDRRERLCRELRREDCFLRREDCFVFGEKNISFEFELKPPICAILFARIQREFDLRSSNKLRYNACTRYESVNTSTTYEQGKVCSCLEYAEACSPIIDGKTEGTKACAVDAERNIVKSNFCTRQLCHLPNLTWEEKR